MHTERATRHIAAEPGQIFRAFTDPELFLRWIVPEGMTGELIDFDAERGYRMRLTYDHPPAGGGKADAESDVSVVQRVEIDIPRRLVERVDFPSDDPSYAGTMTMTWTLDAEPGGTLVTVEASDVPAGIPQDVHLGALVSSLAQLARVVGG